MNPGELMRPLLAEIRTNSRLRWGLVGIAGILWLFGVLELRDAVQRQTDAYRAVSRKLARAQAIATQTEWTSRLEEARAASIDLENRLWKEGTVGLAQATFNDWLAQVAQQAALGRPQLAVSAQEDEATAGKDQVGSVEKGLPAVAGLWKVSARLSFDFNSQGFNRLMTQLANKDRRVVIESLAIRGAPTPRAEMLLVAYFQKSGSGPATPASGGQK